MTMTMGVPNTRFGPSADSLHFDYSGPSSMPAAAQQLASPAFSNPWGPMSAQQSTPSNLNHALYQHPMSHQMQQQHHHQQQQQQQQLGDTSSKHIPQQPLPVLPPHRNSVASGGSPSSLASYGSSASLASSYDQPAPHPADLMAMSQDVMAMNRLPPPTGFADFTTSASPVSATYATAHGAPFDSIAYAANTLRGMTDDRRGFAAALDASQGMLAMSQETPRANAYDARARTSIDSYGFPNALHNGGSTHSTSSSISSHVGGSFNSYYPDSLSEYSTGGSDIESVTSRSSIGPTRIPITTAGLMATGGMPPAPHTMMSQFSSKTSGSIQKKHKCKVCDKRFTRPSSLQTHVYSHTGEKPFACQVQGCERHFSVVSNLRRHMKVHKPDTPSEAGSEDQDREHESD